ncbi:MAG: VOC family protein [Deltaproteobacteria bacterium]|nr:VOC family protein [Deltaproteobacteria bacterium]
MGNSFVWMELTTHNLEGAKEFYAKLFDWKINQFPGGPMPYFIADTGSQPGGGMMSLPEPGVPTAWTVYIAVDDIDKYAAKLTELGGKVWKEPFEVPTVGKIAIVCDPQGAYFGLFQPLPGAACSASTK